MQKGEKKKKQLAQKELQQPDSRVSQLLAQHIPSCMLLVPCPLRTLLSKAGRRTGNIYDKKL